MEAFFTLEATDGSARAGRLATDHGSVQTPIFMAVGTQGAVKACTPAQLEQAGIGLVLANTYHLMLRPGAETVAELGGLHEFVQWDGPMLTDSGGYQVFSLSHRNQVSEEGVTFRSHLNGDKENLTPERSVEIQHALGADIVMQLDDLAALPASREREEEAMRRSLRWLDRCAKALPSQSAQGATQRLFGIVQGGLDPGLREESAKAIVGMDLPGYAIGGLSVGETKRQMREILGLVTPLLPKDRPRYLMGVGYPEDLILAVGQGIDMFDCVLPTRSARHALVFTSRGRVRIRNRGHARETGPLDPDCRCYCCANFSRGYLRHLMLAGEYLGMTLLTIHNLHFYAELMARAREAVVGRRYNEFRDEWLDRVSARAT